MKKKIQIHSPLFQKRTYAHHEHASFFFWPEMALDLVDLKNGNSLLLAAFEWISDFEIHLRSGYENQARQLPKIKKIEEIFRWQELLNRKGLLVFFLSQNDTNWSISIESMKTQTGPRSWTTICLSENV